jgi:hypothetical protein
MFGVGYAASFGDTYDHGMGPFYSRRVLLSDHRSFSLNVLMGAHVPYFGTNRALYDQSSIPGGTDVKGYALLPSFYVGAPVILYPQTGRSYRFILSPRVNFHLIHSSLQVSYPSFPHLNTDTSETRFRLGVGAHLNFEWDLSSRLTLGVGFNPNVLFNEQDYGMWFLYAGTPPLYLR